MSGAVLATILAVRLTLPILQLTQKVVHTIEIVKKLKENRKNNLHFKMIAFNVDLLKKYKESNREMNRLYVTFNQKAKVLAVGNFTNHFGCDAQSMLNLHD